MKKLSKLLDETFTTLDQTSDLENTTVLNKMQAVILEAKGHDGIASSETFKEFESLFKALQKRSER
jgi:hypothetical protein